MMTSYPRTEADQKLSEAKWCIDPSDPNMVRWAYNYLRRSCENVPKLEAEDKYDFCVRLINNLSNDSEGCDVLRKMKGAWRKKQYQDKRKQDGEYSRNYTLSQNTLMQLNVLAGKSNLTETLEKIIEQAYKKHQKKNQMNINGKMQTASGEGIIDDLNKLDPKPLSTHAVLSDGVIGDLDGYTYQANQKLE